MDYYAGIDVSLEQSSVCVVDGSGKIVREAKVASDPESLTDYFTGFGLPLTRGVDTKRPITEVSQFDPEQPMAGRAISQLRTLMRCDIDVHLTSICGSRIHEGGDLILTTLGRQIVHGGPSESMAHAFISYVRENSAEVDRLAEALRDLGIEIWLDREQIAAGSRWQHAIRTAIRDGTCFIACFSAKSKARDRTYMNEELVEAIEELRLRPTTRNWFIPVLLSPCEVPEMSIGASDTLHSLQFVALYEDWDTGVLRIAEAIEPIALAVKRHVDQLADPSARKRIAAADALGNMGPMAKDSIPALATALHDENATVQAVATQAIGKIGTSTSDILKTLKRLVAEGNYYVRRHAASVLGMIGDHEAIPLLIKNLSDNDWRLRESSASALGLLGDAAAIATTPLIAALRDQDLRVREAAASALASIPNCSTDAIPQLIRLLNDEDQWDRSEFKPPSGAGASDRASAARALGALGERARDAVPHLLASLFDSDSRVRCMSASALGNIGDPSVIHALERALTQDENTQARESSSMALRKLKS